MDDDLKLVEQLNKLSLAITEYHAEDVQELAIAAYCTYLAFGPRSGS